MLFEYYSLLREYLAILSETVYYNFLHIFSRVIFNNTAYNILEQNDGSFHDKSEWI